MADITDTDDFKARAAKRRRTWTMTRHPSLDSMKDEEYRAWAKLSDQAKFEAISKVSEAAFALKGLHVRRLRRPHRASE
jgi:hypothetical protein